MTNYHEEEQNYQKIYANIMEFLAIDSEDYKKDPKYIKLLEGLHEKKQL